MGEKKTSESSVESSVSGPMHGSAWPLDASPYKETSLFTQETLPDALRNAHKTRAGVWGRIIVAKGALELTVYFDSKGSCVESVVVINAGEDAGVQPQQTHSVRFLSEGAFSIVFIRERST